MSGGESTRKFYHVYSCDMKHDIQIKVGSLEGEIQRPSYEQLVDDPLLKYSGFHESQPPDMYVSLDLYCNGKQVRHTVRTKHRYMRQRHSWNEWVKLPQRYCDLARNTQLVLTIYTYSGSGEHQPVGGTALSLFDSDGVLRQGQLDLRVHKAERGSGSVPSSTPGLSDDVTDQMTRLTTLAKQHHNGRMARVDWLDRLTFREVEQINEREKRQSEYLFLMIEFPRIHFNDIEHCIVYYEQNGDDAYRFPTKKDVVKYPDFDLDQINLVEQKHHMLARNLRSDRAARDLKPNAQTRNDLDALIALPPTAQISSENSDLIWKFRYYLSENAKALTKLLKCVAWTIEAEASQALKLMWKWAPVQVSDALELLGPATDNVQVRRYAVSRLGSADDEDLLLYLLQLVQALKYENIEEIKSLESEVTESCESALTELDKDPHSKERSGSELFDEDEMNSSISDALQESIRTDRLDPTSGNMNLASFLIYKACSNATFAIYLYWYLLVECEKPSAGLSSVDQRAHEMYRAVMSSLSVKLKTTSAGGFVRSTLNKQQKFVDRLVRVMKDVKLEGGNRKQKTVILRDELSKAENELAKLREPLPLPLDPSVRVTGMNVEKASLCKSSMMPARLYFTTEQGGEYAVLFKHGDDLRQDQLVLQIILLMDKLLRKENLDLKLSPYRVLATGSKHGMVQMVFPSDSIYDVLEKDNTIQAYFKRHAPNPSAPYGIEPTVMDNYIKSCAGYCVITYILGIGDRHMENLLLTHDGRLFHIDFGFILGRDPKPLPPPMRISREMVMAMGDQNSDHFRQFKSLCFDCYLHLRRHSSLILNLFSLMIRANIPDIVIEPDKTVKKVQDKLQLDLSDEEAVMHLQSVIDESVSAVMIVFVEQMHKIAQYMRK